MIEETIKLRPAVLRFAEMIEQHLTDYEETEEEWKTENIEHLLEELDEQEQNLRTNIFGCCEHCGHTMETEIDDPDFAKREPLTAEDRKQVANDAAFLAAICLMIADSTGIM